MLNTEALKQILSTIFKIDDDHIVPITTNWFVPDVKLDGTDYIGYRIISKTPCYKQTGSIFDNQAEKNKSPEQIKISFRLSFVGEHAESLSEKILTWGNNKQIKKLFDSVNSKLDMGNFTTFTYPLKDSNQMAWLADFAAFSKIENK